MDGKVTKLKFQKRIQELDYARGFAMFLMFIDHFIWDILFLMASIFPSFPKPNSGFATLLSFLESYWSSPFRIITREIVLFVFLSMVGILCSFSKNNFKRALKLGIVALILTGLSFILGLIFGNMNDFLITFGVLHCVAISLLIYALIERWIPNKWIYLVLGIVMIGFGIFIRIHYHYQEQNYGDYYHTNVFQIMLDQIVGIKYYGLDNFPLVLYGGEIFLGVFIGKTIYAKKESLFKAKYQNNVITWVGRNSLWLYFAHQIVLPILWFIILLICGYVPHI